MATLTELLERKKQDSRRSKECSSGKVRELNQTESGEALPFDYHSQNLDKEKWLQACQSYDTELGIAVEQGGKRAWIALQRSDGKGELLLLHPLPVFPMNHREEI